MISIYKPKSHLEPSLIPDIKDVKSAEKFMKTRSVKRGSIPAWSIVETLRAW